MGNSQSITNKINIYNIVPDSLDFRDIFYIYNTTEEIETKDTTNTYKETNGEIDTNIETEKEINSDKQKNKENVENVTKYKSHIDLRINIDVLPIYMTVMEEIGISIPCSICSIIYAKLALKNNTLFCPSRCFILYNTFLKNNIIIDTNSSHTYIEIDSETKEKILIQYRNQKLNIREYLKALKQYGVCDEKNYQCNISTLLNRPSDFCYNEGKYLQFNYKKVKNNINTIKYLLSKNEIILCNLSVYSSFIDSDTIKTGKIKMPHKEYDSYIGMIACTLVGYIDKMEQFIVRFTLGNYWGDKGYGYLSYEYAGALINDLWIIEMEIPYISLNTRYNPQNSYNHQNYQIQNPQNSYNHQIQNSYNQQQMQYQQNNPNDAINRKKYMIGGLSSL